MSYRDIIYKNYLKLGFEDMNTSDFERTAKIYELNYNDLITSRGRILDIGCGMGHFLYYLKSRNLKDFLGIDIGNQQVNYCRHYITDNVEYVEDIFEFLDSFKNCYDLIVMNDVLEHFNKEEVVKLLEKVKGALIKGGRIIIRTPNMDNPFASGSRYIDFTHEVGFSEVSIRQVLEAVGFKGVKCRGEKLYINSRIKRMFFKVLHTLYTKLLRFIVWIDRPGDNYPTIFTKNLIVWAKRNEM